MTAHNSIYLLFEQTVRSYPDQPCVLIENSSYTYFQIEEEVSKLHLAILHHAADEKIIGVSTLRGVDQVIMVLAILKAGKAYLPIDFEYPKTRLERIITNSKVKFCLVPESQSDQAELLGLRVLPKYESAVPIAAELIELGTKNAAYILYTSGSTGEPKGVCMGQDAAVNLIEWQNQNSSAVRGTRTLQFAPLSFDVSFQEIMSTLSTGGTLVLVDDILRLDMIELLSFIEQHTINRLFLPFVALQALAEAAVSTSNFPQCLKEVMTAGEQLKITSQLSDFFSKLPECKFYNQYGPTECHVVSELRLEGKPSSWPVLPTIGKPISNTSILILDQKQQILPHGEIGELCIAGVCLADGYLNNEKLTNEKFVFLQSSENNSIRVYRTGDMARYLSDGNIEFLGRKDDQVKISGHRIELAEVELALNSLPGIQQAVVVASNHNTEQTQLVAYLQSNSQPEGDTAGFRKQAADVLPNYMLPTFYVWLADFPRTSSGKIDKNALPAPLNERPSSAPLYKRPVTSMQKSLANCWSEVLQVPKIGVDDNFFEMGGTSLRAQKVAAILRKRLELKLPVTKIYQHPTIAALASSLEVADKTKVVTNFSNQKEDKRSTDVAIIGMAGRFPGANTIEELWEVLREGKETTTFFTPEEIDSSVSESLRNDPMYVAARGIVPSVKTFDAAFFGLSPKLAEAMDPQQRLFLEIAWEALEQTGHLPIHYKGSMGVYAGTGTNTYYKNNVLPNEELIGQVGHLQADTVNEKDYISSRTAFHLNLKGPAVSVQSACSTSLLAIAEAVEAIRNGQCDIALAGGSSITAPMYTGHLYQEGSILSEDGHCRTFDAKATGTVFSDGAGVVLLKSLAAAKEDGDYIYGLVKGVGINNDGGNKGSFTAPSVEGQANAITRALHDAQISPSTISYIEAHGTATPLGDPIEMEGLHMAFGEQEENSFCAIGSIKSNIGHLTAAAGVTGFIKTVLAMHHQQIPASLGYNTPNPAIDFENSPFFVNAALSPWDVAEVRRAGVSSFGVGGTNVHVILEEFLMDEKTSDTGRPMQLLPWSAKSETSLANYGTELGNYLNKNAEVNLADVAYSLKVTRESFSQRQFVIANTTSDAAKQLIDVENNRVNKNILKAVPNEIVFLFPGQGAQYIQMGKALYEHETVFTEAVDLCAELLMDTLKQDIRELIFPKINDIEAENRLKDTRFTQPALFVIEYAVAQLWMSWGIQPTLYCGHSIGEFVGAHLAGVFSLKDALHLIATRGRLVSELPGGSMLSVRLSADKVLELLPDTLSMGAMNSDQLSVVSGPDSDIEKFAKILNEKEVPNKLLLTSHAFHSDMMDPVLDTFKDEVEKVTLNAPDLPIISTVTGTWLTEAEAKNPEYWTDHLRATVRFTDAMDTIMKLEDVILLEVGPGRALSTLARQKKDAKSLTTITSLPIPKNEEGSYPAMLNALGQLWMNGVAPDWQAFYKEQSRQKVNLPSYQFDRKPCWAKHILSKPKEIINPTTIISQVPVAQVVTPVHIDNDPKPMRKPIILNKISELINNASGIAVEASDANHTFLELGLDSLILTQIALSCKKEFHIPISFRQLNEEFSTPELLASHLDANLPAEVYAQATPTPVASAMPNTNFSSTGNPNSALNLIAQQLQFLGGQVAALQGNIPAPVMETAVAKPIPAVSILTEEEKIAHKKPFGASPRIEKKSTDLNEDQQEFLQKLILSYNKKTKRSKGYSQDHRAKMADPRVVSGFKPLTKELIYPIVVEKSSGNRLWDLDGNQYIDTLNGFGSSIFGHQPDFIKEVLKKQIDSGYEVGPQHPLAGEVCELLCEFTKHERAALCNTGSEAVLGAMRIARTVTGRSLVVAFSGSYHGINDEGLVRGSKKLRTFPAAAGIMPEAVQNMLILDYGTEESLRIIRERAHELAAVLVEPVQSRRPEFVPLEFLKEVREITAKSEVALIFDEVITGFRSHPGGFQAKYGIKADLASYGKVIGGGLSIGAIVGNREYMDALDGGFWEYGDTSYPEVGVTYFAGTFVRHPLALAAAKASLDYMKEKGEHLQNGLTAMTERMAYELNLAFAKRKLPIKITHFSSLWRLKMLEDVPYSELLFVLLREKGIHIWDGFPCFMTEAFSPDDVDLLIDAFLNSLDEMVVAGFFKTELSHDDTRSKPKTPLAILNTPPVKGARLGKDESGNPAWFVADLKKEGNYIKIKI